MPLHFENVFALLMQGHCIFPNATRAFKGQAKQVNRSRKYNIQARQRRITIMLSLNQWKRMRMHQTKLQISIRGLYQMVLN